MGEQITIEDWIQKKEPSDVRRNCTKEPEQAAAGQNQHMPAAGSGEDPPCYSCFYAVRRGPFRLCVAHGPGYLKIGKEVICDQYKEVSHE